MPHVEPDEHPDHESRRARRIRLRINPSDLLLEIISIVIAIVLATAVGQLVDRVRTQRQTHEALVQLRREIATDEVVLKRRAPMPASLARVPQRGAIGANPAHGIRHVHPDVRVGGAERLSGSWTIGALYAPLRRPARR